MVLSRRQRACLPGFGLSLAVTGLYLSLLLLVPLAALGAKTASLTWPRFVAAAWSEQAKAAYFLTFSVSLMAAAIDVILGLLLAWVLARYEFVGRGWLDMLIDLPLALPTAVAGLVYASLYMHHGWYGWLLVPLGIQGVHSRFAIVLVLVFLGLPFVVRTLQPILATLDAEQEEAAASLGASRWQTWWRVLFPALLPGLATGFALALARGLGEYGSVVFVSGNMPFKTEIAPVLIVARLEQFAYAEATAIAMVLLTGSLACLGLVNYLERRSRRHERV